MSRRLAVSLSVGLAFLGVAALAQPPKEPPPKGAEKKAVDPVEAQIKAALANDPDIRVAEAKVRFAEAELSKVRQATAQKVVMLNAAIAEQKPALAAAEENYRLVSKLHQTGNVGLDELLKAREKLDTAKAKLATLEMELKLLTGGGPKVATGGDAWEEQLNAIHKITRWEATCFACHKEKLGKNEDVESVAMKLNGLLMKKDPPAAGSIPARIRLALDKKVKLGAKGEQMMFDQALEIFKKEAGLDVPVRVDARVNHVFSLGEELPVVAWLQLFADGTQGTVILVREYGLLVTNVALQPPEGISVFDFYKQTPVPKQ